MPREKSVNAKSPRSIKIKPTTYKEGVHVMKRRKGDKPEKLVSTETSFKNYILDVTNQKKRRKETKIFNPQINLPTHKKKEISRKNEGEKPKAKAEKVSDESATKVPPKSKERQSLQLVHAFPRGSRAGSVEFKVQTILLYFLFQYCLKD